MNNRITTIIPFYNSKDTLAALLNSILEGTAVPSEIILVNDGSTDSSPDIALYFSKAHPFIRVMTQEHSGVSNARNLAIGAATGDWISFLDADDYIEPDMYSGMLDTILASREQGISVDGCLCGYYTHKDGTVTPNVPSHQGICSSHDLLKYLFTDDGVNGFLFTRLFKASVIKELSFDSNIKLCEDLLFQAQLFSSHDLRFCITPKPLYHYIQNNSSATGAKNFFEGDVFGYRPAYEKIASITDAPCVSDSYNKILNFCMYSLLIEYRNTKDERTLQQIRLMQKEMKKASPPSGGKSKRRIAYELAPVILSRLLR